MLLMLASTWTLTGTFLPLAGCSVQLRARSRFFRSWSAPESGSGDLMPAGRELAFSVDMPGGATFGMRVAHRKARRVAKPTRPSCRTIPGHHRAWAANSWSETPSGGKPALPRLNRKAAPPVANPTGVPKTFQPPGLPGRPFVLAIGYRWSRRDRRRQRWDPASGRH